MIDQFKENKKIISLINYHFVFCSRYRRKIFQIPGVEKRMIELTMAKCREEEIDILAMKCDIDHVCLIVNVYPQTSIQKIMGSIRGYTSKILREEFVELSRMSSLWTRSYLVSTEPVSSETIRWYVEQQKTRE